MDKNKEPELKIEIQIDDEIASGKYVNMAVVNHNDSEFVLDFIYVQPQAPKAKVQSRLIMSPKHAKRLMQVLQHNVHIYEQRHGAITLENGSKPQVDTDSPIH